MRHDTHLQDQRERSSITVQHSLFGSCGRSFLHHNDNCYNSALSVIRIPCIHASKIIVKQTLISHRIGASKLHKSIFQVEPDNKPSSEMR